jgi:ribosomal protein S6
MDKVQRSYELTYLVPGSLTDSEVAQVRSEVETLLKKYKAEVVKTEDWGRKPLAYIITHEGKKQSDAMYVHIVFTLSTDKAQQFEHDIYLVTRIMRHLMLLAEEANEAVEVAAE